MHEKQKKKKYLYLLNDYIRIDKLKKKKTKKNFKMKLNYVVTIRNYPKIRIKIKLFINRIIFSEIVFYVS